MEDKVFITLEKFKALKQEIKVLKTKERKKIADKLSQFRDTVDLVEDSAYNDLLLEQANLEEQIDTIEHVLENATIVKARKSVKIGLGSTVIILQSGKRKNMEITIVGSIDADPLTKSISNESPLGKALLGKKKDDIVEVLLPTGKIKYKIIDIK